MAKKGGVSQINGFVSIKNEDLKTTTKKVASSTSSESQKKVYSINQKPSRTSSLEAQKLKQSENSVIKHKTVTTEQKSKLLTSSQKPKSTTSEQTKPKKVNATTSQNATILNSKTTTSKPNGSVKVTRPTAPDTSKTSLKVKTTESALKIGSTTRRSTELKSKPEVKSKLSTPPKKDVPAKKESGERKIQQFKTTANPSPVKTSKTDNVKKVVESHPRKTVGISDPKIERKIERKVEPKASVISTSRNKSSETSSKNTTSKNKNDVTTIKITSKEVANVTVKDSSLSKDRKQDEINIKSSHKDSLYFEIDMGNKKEILKKPVKLPEDISSEPPPISRQGTFTKDEDESSIALPVVSSDKDQSSHATEDDNDEYDYEDDFEDYESDFEEYVSESGVSSDSDSEISKTEKSVKPTITEESSTKIVSKSEKTVEEERKLDSGSYDLTTKSVNYILPQSLKQKQLDQIKESISRENSLYSERGKVKEIVKPSIEKEKPDALDFIDALRRQEAESAKKIKKNRSTLILEKIKLHTQQISIFEAEFFFLDSLDPLYENRDVSHVSTEAEVDKHNEEAQSEEIKTCDKWVQFPKAFHKLTNANDDLHVLFEDHRGFGGDNVEIDINSWLNPFYNPEKFYNFIESAGQVILIMLEEEERWKSDGSISVMKAKHDHGFSRGYIPIQTKNIEFLKNRPICDIVFSPHNQNIFLSSHRSVKDIENLQTFEDQFLGRSVICLWNILEPSQPLSMFVASCQISAISFDIAHTNLLFGGLTDGSVCLWDTNERSIFHKETVAGGFHYLLRTPSYCSSSLQSNDLHNNVIVAIQSLGYETKSHSPGKFSPTEILTLDSDGKIILWVTVSITSDIESNFVVEKEDFGQTPWSKYKLVASKTLNPASSLPSSQNTWSLQFLCMSLAFYSSKSVLVGTNTGSVVHCILSEEKALVPVYSDKEETDCIISISSIEKSPHDIPVFLAGCSNGTVRIHLMERKRPIRILVMESQLRGSPVTKIRWSNLGAGLFFILDKNLCLHLWDLCKRESSPLVSLPLKKLKATHFDISTYNKFIYMGLVVHKERLEIHRLKEQFTPEGVNNSERDREIFLSFVDKCCY